MKVSQWILPIHFKAPSFLCDINHPNPFLYNYQPLASATYTMILPTTQHGCKEMKCSEQYVNWWKLKGNCRNNREDLETQKDHNDRTDGRDMLSWYLDMRRAGRIPRLKNWFHQFPLVDLGNVAHSRGGFHLFSHVIILSRHMVIWFWDVTTSARWGSLLVYHHTEKDGLREKHDGGDWFSFS